MGFSNRNTTVINDLTIYYLQFDRTQVNGEQEQMSNGENCPIVQLRNFLQDGFTQQEFEQEEEASQKRKGCKGLISLAVLLHVHLGFL